MSQRKIQLGIWAALTLLAYYILLFTQYGNFYHGGEPFGLVLLDALVVLAAYYSFHIVRTEKLKSLRVVGVLVGVPLGLFVLVSLWYGLGRIIAV